MAHLEFAQQADTHHLDSGKNEDAGDDEDGAVQRHDVLAGDDFENEQPGRQAAASEHAERAERAEEVQRAGHVAEQEADGEQIEEDAEGAGDAVVALPCSRAGFEIGISQMLAPYQDARAGMKRCISP